MEAEKLGHSFSASFYKQYFEKPESTFENVDFVWGGERKKRNGAFKIL